MTDAVARRMEHCELRVENNNRCEPSFRARELFCVPGSMFSRPHPSALPHSLTPARTPFPNIALLQYDLHAHGPSTSWRHRSACLANIAPNVCVRPLVIPGTLVLSRGRFAFRAVAFSLWCRCLRRLKGGMKRQRMVRTA
jgi:hypothetical protein